MTEQDVMDRRIELIRSARAAGEAGDRGAVERTIRDLVHPDCEWMPLIAGVEGGPYRGPEGALAFFDDFLGAFDVRYGETEFRPVGSDALIELTSMQMRGRESEVQVNRELGVVYEFEGDRMRRGRAYDSHARAIKEAEALVA